MGIALLLLVVQQDWTVLKPEDRPKEMVQHALLAEAADHFEARRKAIAAIRSPEALRARQAEMHRRFVRAIGGFPERTPLKPRVTGMLRRDGYRVEKVVYESRPDHHVTAALYIPDGDGPFPGVLMPMGHSSNGKAAGYAQRGSILLAKNGIAVLNYDPIGQGERHQLLDGAGKPAIPRSTAEHTQVGIGALLVGWCAASYRIWDGIRSLDYLAGRPEVDPERLGCTGCSGGGTMTSYLMALDERIAVAAPSCYLTTLERLFATIGPQDAEQNITGQVAFGMEHADYVTMRAPRPTLMATATRDFFDIGGAWQTFREAKLMYGILGLPERVSLVEFDTKHGYPKPQREAVVRWMRRWLLSVDDAVVEPDFPVEKDEDLRCTKTGHVLSALGGRSAFDLNAERARVLAADRKPLTGDALRDAVARVLGIPRVAPAAASGPAAVRGVVKRDGYEVIKSVRTPDRGVPLPALTFAGGGSRFLTVLVHENGKAAEAGPGRRLEEIARSGNSVIAPDLMGLGETVDSAFKTFFLSVHLGKSLLARRVEQLLTLTPSGAPERYRLIGIGRAGPIVLHAAVLNPRVAAVTIERGLISFQNIVETPMSRDLMTSVVPGALEVYDLPDLAAAIAPRPLTIRGPVDARGEPVSQAALEKTYAPAIKAYAAAGAADKLRLEAAR